MRNPIDTVRDEQGRLKILSTQVIDRIVEDNSSVEVIDTGGTPTVVTTLDSGLAATQSPTALTLAAGVDVYPDAATLGLVKRIYGELGSDCITHHRNQTIPTGYTWQGAPFVTPGVVSNSPNDFLQAYHSSGWPVRGFLARIITNAAANWQNKLLLCRATGGINAEAGIRIDAGNDNTYAEIYANGTAANGTLSLTFRYRIGGAVPVVVPSSINVPCHTNMDMALLSYWDGANYYLFGYLYGAQFGQLTNVSGFSTPAVTAYFPATGRIGYMVHGPGGQNAMYWDWLKGTF